MEETGVVKKLERRRDPTKTRERLIESGIALFNKPGFFFTDSNQIARHAGFAPGTFYQHFKNKNELFMVVYQLWLDTIKKQVEESLAKNKSVDEFVNEMSAMVIKQFQDWAGFRASMRALVATDAPARDFHRQKINEVIEVIQRAQKHFNNSESEKKTILESLLVLEKFADSLSEGLFEFMNYSEEDIFALIKKNVLILFGKTH